MKGFYLVVGKNHRLKVHSATSSCIIKLHENDNKRAVPYNSFAIFFPELGFAGFYPYTVSLISPKDPTKIRWAGRGRAAPPFCVMSLKRRMCAIHGRALAA